MLEGVFDVKEIGALSMRLSATLEGRSEPSVLRSRGHTYGSRNLLETFPEAVGLVKYPPLNEFATAVLGQEALLFQVTTQIGTTLFANWNAESEFLGRSTAPR